ncbi:site-2 protease family protein [Anaerotalea alkaliphila]|uniref:Zinc metalloprotease n=1 Tax=Anaerotalea alkaliphila TaxID=2662126 RepID=A0A7X5HTW6_9FIRM|nr:site-2 protease family protein [Anaerotalea alkaliphila]NDL66578.1 CBS domain-containing protein [Anaerotalea alkaliphila]
MKGSIVLVKVKGIEIELHFSWFFIFVLIAYSMGTGYFPGNHPELSMGMVWFLSALVPLLMVLSVLLHELSHSLVSKHLGIDVKRITLFIFGGLAQMDREPDEPDKELKIALAGPAMSLLLFLVFSVARNVAGLLGLSPALAVPLEYAGSLNLMLALFNMVPAYPLDGGRVLRALIWRRKGNLQLATRVAATMGDIFGYSLMFLGLLWFLSGNTFSGVWFLFLGWFIKQLAESSYQNTMMNDLFHRIRVGAFMTEPVATVDGKVSVQDLVDHYFYKYKFVCFPVRNQETVTGVVTLEGVRSLGREAWDQTDVDSIAIPLREEYLVAPWDTVDTALNKITANGLGRVLVMEEGNLVGIISRSDILHYIRVYSRLND